MHNKATGVSSKKSFLANTYNISAKAFPGIAEKFDKFLLRGLLKKNEISRI